MILFFAINARCIGEQGHQQRKDKIDLDHFQGRSSTAIYQPALKPMIVHLFLSPRRLLWSPQQATMPAIRPSGYRPCGAGIAICRLAHNGHSSRQASADICMERKAEKSINWAISSSRVTIRRQSLWSKAPEPTTAASVKITDLHYSIEFRNSTQIVDQRSIFTGPIHKIGESTCALFSRGLCWCGTECLREHYIKFPIRHTGSHGVELLGIRSAKIAGGRLLGVQRG